MKKLVLVSLGAIVLTLTWFHAGRSTANAALSSKQAMRSYSPPFHEWVTVWLKVHYQKGRSAVGNLSGPHIWSDRHKGRIQWKVTWFAYNESALKYAQHHKINLRRIISLQLKDWRAEGYEIGMADFQFVIEHARPTPTTKKRK